MAIISISGYAGSGKDTVGKLIQYNLSKDSNTPIEEVIEDYNMNEWWLEEMSGWEIKKWAGKLKYIASILTGIPVDKFEDQEFKKTNLGPEWNYSVALDRDNMFQEHKYWEEVPMTVRDLLQKLGTEAMRDGLHTNTWVNALMADYKPTQVQWSQGPMGGYEDGPIPNWLITDTRFPNEADSVKSKGGILVNVERVGVKPVNGHSSENALDQYTFDYTIHNNGSLADLNISVKEFLNSALFAAL